MIVYIHHHHNDFCTLSLTTVVELLFFIHDHLALHNLFGAHSCVAPFSSLAIVYLHLRHVRSLAFDFAPKQRLQSCIGRKRNESSRQTGKAGCRESWSVC